ncbi:MAG: ATP-binding cassette domain-containing protein [Chloroflexota bacterium]
MFAIPILHLPYSGRRHVEAAPGAAALEASAVVVGYEGVGEAALHGVSLSVLAGTRVALVGPNGAGKSTLLKAAAGLLPLRRGRLLIYGQPVGACHHRVAYLPQRGEVDWRFPITLRRLVLTGRYVHLGWLKRPSPLDWQVADEAIEQMGLAGLTERQISHLSGGQQQRALLARALAQDADLLLLDEPLNAVDNETRAVVVEVLARLQRQGKAAVVATHDLGRLEADFDSALYLSDGRLVPAPPGSFGQD